MKYLLRQLSSFIAPVVLCILVPYAIVASKSNGTTASIFNPDYSLALLGFLICLFGFVGFLLTVRMFILIGKGTIMPWDPTRRLVTGSLYAYVRNPMILSVLLIVAGEALLFASIWLALMALLFFAVNTVYFIYSEEPGLERRFGQAYVEYKRHVPRWMPRLSPWHPSEMHKGIDETSHPVDDL